MADDEYELLPREELDYLRKEVERLKRNPLGDTQASVSLLDGLNRLNENVAKLADILASANDEMVKTFHDNSVQEQLRKLRDENAKIAHGIVALSELVKSVKVAPPPPSEPEPTFEFGNDAQRPNPFMQPNIGSPDEPEPPLPPPR